MVPPSVCPAGTGWYIAFLIEVVSRPLLPLKDGEAGVLDWFLEDNREFMFLERPFSDFNFIFYNRFCLNILFAKIFSIF